MKTTYMILLTLWVIPCFTFGQKHELEQKINDIFKDKNVSVGVAVLYDGKDTLTINDEHQYPTMSVYKFHQALALIAYMSKYDIPLEAELYIKKSDLDKDTYSPLRDTHPEGNFNISIGELIQYAVSQSDNNASNILFNYMSGTRMTDLYVRSLGIDNFSISATESDMDRDFNNQYLNWSTPLEAVRLLDLFLKKELFSENYKKFLINAMIETSTGSDKLKSGLPKDVIIGHKTGSSSRNLDGLKVADNDLGFVCLPNGKQYAIAVFVMNSKESNQTNAAIISQISKTVYDYYSQYDNR